VLSPVLQASAAAGVAWYLAHVVLGHAQPFFAPIAATVALSTSHVQRARRSVQMVVGVLLGIGVSELLQPLLGNGVPAIAAVVLVTLLVAVAVGIGFVGEGMMFVNQAAASAILVIALHRAGTGAERAVDALVGGGVALLIGVGLFPVAPLRLLWDAERRVLSALLDVLERCQAPGDIRADADWALMASHGVHRRLASLAQARSTARAAVRVAPRRMALRGRVDLESERVARMNLLAGAVLGLMRTIIDVREHGDLHAPPGEVAQLAAALRDLRDAPRPWAGETLAAVEGRMARLLALPAPREPLGDAIVASVLRRVARDVLRLLPDAAAWG
jgi:uncharacterized membrane protein YgaE (UPF0421/DUF939 family)